MFSPHVYRILDVKYQRTFSWHFVHINKQRADKGNDYSPPTRIVIGRGVPSVDFKCETVVMYVPVILVRVLRHPDATTNASIRSPSRILRACVKT